MSNNVLSPDERQALLLSVGTHKGHRPLSPIEVAEIFQKSIDAGWTLSQCASAASLEGTTWVTRFLRLLKLPDTVKHLVDWGGGRGTIGLANASEIARLQSSTDEEILIKAVLANRLTVSEVRQVVQLRKRSHRALQDCLNEVLQMRPQVEHRHIYIGAITDPILKQRLGSLTQHNRDQLLEQAVLKLKDIPRPVVIKLGTERFTLVGGGDFGKVIASRGETLEQDINNTLLHESNQE